jgi:hypothetical protein
MNKTILVFFTILSLNLFSQNDRNGNPVFNSITISEEKINDYQLNSNYYTLVNNIDNKNSSVFISENPSLDQIESAAIKLPSDFFLVIKDGSPVHIIMIVDTPKRVFFVVNPSAGTNQTFPCDIKEDITENRANEIVKQKYDKNAKIQGNKLFFNNKEFTISSNKEIQESIKKLIHDQKLNTGKSGDIKIMDKGMIRKMIIDETKEGGKLDFFTDIKGHEMDGIQVKPGIFSTKVSIALYKWGRSNYELGVNTVENAIDIWSEIKNRKTNQREIEYITMGFNKELEK